MLGDLFEIKQVEFEGAGTEKLGRRKVITPVAYCNSPVELFKRWMGEEKFEEVQNSGSLIPVKIGCDGGQGFLKWSAQLLEVSANSVSNLMILCVVDIPETTSNLRTLADLPCLSDRFTSPFCQPTIVSDLKVANIITSITHGCYPCIYCTWRKSDGINFDDAEPRTAELQSSLVTELQERYGGNKKKSKFVRGVNGIPVFPSIDALHLFCPPELHLLLGIVKRLCTGWKSQSPTINKYRLI